MKTNEFEVGLKLRQDRLLQRLDALEVAEYTIMQLDAGVPAHVAREGTPYWDMTNDDLYINIASGGAVWQLIGGGGGPGFPHTILSATHTDSTPAAVVRGDLMTGQGVVPAWAGLAHPAAADHVLQSTALEIGWSGSAVTFPAAGAVPVGTGAANRAAYWSGVNTLTNEAQLALLRGGTAADLSATGGVGQYVQQAGVGAAFTVGVIPAAHLPAHTHAGAGQGGSLVIGTTDTDATLGSVLFAGVAGVIQEDNANFFWDDTNNRLGVGVAVPEVPMHAQSTLTAVTNFLILEGDRNVTDTEVGILFKDRNAIAGGQEVGRIWTDRQGVTGNFDLVFQAGDQGLAGLQTESIRIRGNTGFVGFNTVPDRQNHTEVLDAVTAAVTWAQRLTHVLSAGTAAVGFGVGIELELETDGGQDVMGQLFVKLADATHATRRGTFGIDLNRQGSFHEAARIVAADAAPVAGNARGAGAVDFGAHRSAATEVASGIYSVISGGAFNTASGTHATVGGGSSNIASGDPGATVAGGGGNYATQDYATVSGGFLNQATGVYSAIPGGYYTLADKFGQIASASGRFGAIGDAQGTIQFVARRVVTHSDANWYELFLDGAAQRMTVASDTVWTFDTLIVGTTAGCTKSFGFRIEGTVENDGGTTTLLASTVTTIYDADDVSFDARASADDPNDALLIEVQDADGTGDTVRWVATTRTSEVSY